MIQKNTIKLGILLFLYIAGPCWALKEDKEKHIFFQSNSLFYDYKKNNIHYLGNVHAQQGSTQLFADKMVIFNNQNKISKLIANGHPAHYQTLLFGNKQLHAMANQIIYLPEIGKVALRKNVKIIQDNNEFFSDFITLDLRKQSISSNPSHGGVTKIVLEPINQLKEKLKQPGDLVKNGKTKI